MTNRTWSANILVVALIVAIPLLANADDQVKNPGFESKQESWGIAAATGEDNAIFVDESVSHSGAASLCIRHKSKESYSRATTMMTLKPDTEYTASVWIKLDNVAPAASAGSARLYIPNDKGGTLAASPVVRGTSGWKKAFATFNSGKRSSIPLILYLHHASGTAWFDDVEITEGKLTAEAGKQKLSGLNLANGKKYTMSQKPNYKLCADANDATQLTDGIFAGDKLWTDQATVGWQSRGNVEIILDLGTVEPIREIAINTQGGAKGNVNFPDAAFFVSDDGKNFYYVGSRFGSNMEDRGERYSTRYHLNDLAIKGRYVAVVLIANGTFTFADELEVIKGDFSLASVTLKGTTYTAGNLASAILNMRAGIREAATLRREIAPLKKLLKKNIPELVKEFAAVDKELNRPDLNPQELTSIRLRAEILNAQVAQAVYPGKTLLVCPGNEWKDFGKFDIPTGDSSGIKSLNLTMGNDEYESTSFVAFNATTKPDSIKISVSDLKGKNGAIPQKDITLRYGEWVECNDGLMRPDALPLADGGVPIAPGTNRSFWVTVKTDHTPAGEYSGLITLNDGKEIAIPLAVTVLPVSLPRPLPVSTYNWAYLNFAPTKANPEAAVADLAAHYIDTAVLHPADLPKFTFDQQGNITAKDYSAFDHVIKLHQKAGINKFLFFCNFGTLSTKTASLGAMSSGKTTIKFNTPEWKNAMRNFIVNWVEHLKTLNVDYNQFAFYPFDESADDIMTGSGKEVLAMFKASDPKARIFFDPTPKNSVEGMKQFAPHVDIWCPHLVQTLDQERLDFFAAEQRAGKQVNCYNCQGPDKTFSPLGHYRKMLWQAWAYGLTGAAHWNYADTGWKAGSNSAWTDFDGDRSDFSIIYDSATAPKHITRKEAQIPSRRWEAWRDGVEDYAYLWMLKQAVEKAKKSGDNSVAIKNAETALKSSVVAVLADPSDIAAYRTGRRSVLEAIAELNKK